MRGGTDFTLSDNLRQDKFRRLLMTRRFKMIALNPKGILPG